MADFVLDNSVAMRWLLESEKMSDQKYAEQVLESLEYSNALTPNLWHLEASNVLLGAETPKTGLYLPMNSIKPINDKTGEIFVAVDGRAKKIKVKILGNVGELFRLEAFDPGDVGTVTPGARVITDHIHFLQHDEPIRIIKTAELKP